MIDNVESEWKYFSTAVDSPSTDEYRVAHIDAMVVMRVDTNGNIEYRLQLPEWKIKQEVVRMVEDWEYLRQIEKPRMPTWEE